MSYGNEPEKPTKPWEEYSELDLSNYILRNFKKADCSFSIRSSTRNINSKKELRSFTWMLREISPVLKGMLTNDSPYRCDRFETITVHDENFEDLLAFVHTKTLRDGSFNKLPDLYVTAIKYESRLLKEAIRSELHCKNPVGNWIRFAELAWRDRNTFPELKETFNDILVNNPDWKNTAVCELESIVGVEALMRFEFKEFDEFLKFFPFPLKPLVAFKSGEAYLLKNIFKDKLEEEDSLSIIVVNEFFKYVDFDKMTIEDFDKGPAQSALLNEELKIYYRSFIRK